MNEYVTNAFILDIEAFGESDLRAHLFTKKLGRVSALARAARKPSAKLAAHIQPLAFSTVRLVERRGFQIVDALKIFCYPATAQIVDVCQLIVQLTNLYQPDPALWELIEQQQLASRELLKILGFDPAHALCSVCGKVKPEHFVITATNYVCRMCLHQKTPPQTMSANPLHPAETGRVSGHGHAS